MSHALRKPTLIWSQPEATSVAIALQNALPGSAMWTSGQLAHSDLQRFVP